MKDNEKNMCKKILIILLTFILAFMSVGLLPEPVSAAGQKETKNITLPVAVSATKNLVDWDFTYSDSWFERPAKEYNHELARMSLGLACASFRLRSELEEEAGKNLEKALTEAGFQDIRSDDYDKATTLYTVSTEMGHKTIQDSGETYELIAVAVCGGGYGNEWLSNLSVGNEERHVGFTSASGEVFDRIFGYIGRLNITGKVKIWLTGFSRGAAIANMTGADLTDCGKFRQEDVFVYTFATPNNTKASFQHPYDNIHNIVGKNDFVPKIPMKEWGFTRYGTDLYTPTIQTDSDFKEKEEKASRVYRKLTGFDMWDMTAVENELHTLMGCLLKMVPNQETYANHLQDRILNVWTSGSVITILKTLISISEDRALVNDENRREVNSMLDFLAFTMLEMMMEHGSLAESWNKRSGIAGNLMFDHTPETYLSWLFSDDDPDRIFSDRKEYTRMIIEGNVTVALVDADASDDTSYFHINAVDSSGKFLDELNAGTKETPEMIKVNREYSCGYMKAGEGKTMLILPKDKSFLIGIFSEKDQDVTVSFAEMSSDYAIPFLSKGDVMHLKKGAWSYSGVPKLEDWGNNVLVTGESMDSVDFSVLGESDIMSEIIKMETSLFPDMSWRSLVLAIITMPVAFVALVIFIIFLITGIITWRWKRRKQVPGYERRYNPIPLICLVIMFASWPVTEVYAGLLPKDTLWIAVRTGIAGCMAVIMMLFQYLRNRNLPNLLLLIAIVTAVAGSILDVFNGRIAMFFFAGAAALLCISSIVRVRPGKMQLILWGFISAVLIAADLIVAQSSGFELVFSIIHIMLLTLTVITGLSYPLKTRIGVFGFVLFCILFALFNPEEMRFIYHFISMGVLYISLAILSNSQAKATISR